jgi:hypothetical protein
MTPSAPLRALVSTATLRRDFVVSFRRCAPRLPHLPICRPQRPDVALQFHDRRAQELLSQLGTQARDQLLRFVRPSQLLDHHPQTVLCLGVRRTPANDPALILLGRAKLPGELMLKGFADRLLDFGHRATVSTPSRRIRRLDLGGRPIRPGVEEERQDGREEGREEQLDVGPAGHRFFRRAR